MRYRQKPVETRQFTGEMDAKIEVWLGDAFYSWAPGARELDVETRLGLVTAHASDWVIREPDGEFRVLSGASFAATYEAVEDA